MGGQAGGSHAVSPHWLVYLHVIPGFIKKLFLTEMTAIFLVTIVIFPPLKCTNRAEICRVALVDMDVLYVVFLVIF